MANVRQSKVAADEAEADRQLDELEKVRVEPRETAPVETPATAPESTPEPTAQPQDEPTPDQPVKEDVVSKSDYERMKARLDTLEGKYRAEVPRFAEQLREKEVELNELRERLKNVKTEPQKPQLPPHLRNLSDQERADLDPTGLELQGKVAQGVVDDATDKLQQKIANLEAAINQDRVQRAQVAEAGIWSEVHKVHPGAQGMDVNDPSWAQFLDQAHEDTGEPNRSIGMRAMKSGNAAALIKLISRYKGVSDDNGSTVAAQVKPRTATTAATPRSTQKPILSKEDQVQLLKEVRQNKWLGKEAELEAKLDEFSQAEMEGRLR